MGTMDEIKKLLDGVKKYSDGKILGFPGSETLPVAREAFNIAMKLNSNAINLHFRGKICEERKGEKEKESIAFAPIHQMERELLAWLTMLLYKQGNTYRTIEKVVKDCKDYQDVWGYMTGGGTESNIFALWVARNYFQEKFHCKSI